MNWIHFSCITIALYGLHDIMLKKLAETVNSTFASIAINGSAALVLLAYFLWQPPTKWRESTSFFSANTGYLVIAGISLGIATITFMNAFNRGGNLSIAVPMVYVGVIGICMLTGVVYFQESLNWKQLLGAGLAIAGIFLMTSTK